MPKKFAHQWRQKKIMIEILWKLSWNEPELNKKIMLIGSLIFINSSFSEMIGIIWFHWDVAWSWTRRKIVKNAYKIAGGFAFLKSSQKMETNDPLVKIPHSELDWFPAQSIHLKRRTLLNLTQKLKEQQVQAWKIIGLWHYIKKWNIYKMIKYRKLVKNVNFFIIISINKTNFSILIEIIFECIIFTFPEAVKILTVSSYRLFIITQTD
jgi:hypothetical protein